MHDYTVRKRTDVPNLLTGKDVRLPGTEPIVEAALLAGETIVAPGYIGLRKHDTQAGETGMESSQ